MQRRQGLLFGLIVAGLAIGRMPGAAARPQSPADAASSIGTPKRLPHNPIVTPQTDPSLGKNIDGPTLIRVPAWVEKPLGAYYLYFADHRGKYIRMAYADKLDGPWKVYAPGTLQLAQSFFTDHIASPEVVVDNEHKQIRMFYHGLTPEERSQHTRVATSTDGLHFTATQEPVGKGSAYWRLFHYGDWWYALAMPGRLFRSRDGISHFEAGPQLFPPSQVHNAPLVQGDTLTVFYTRTGDTPERIVVSQVKLTPDWTQWKPTEPHEFLKPELPWEGANLPLQTTHIGALEGPENALRDPAIFQEAGKTYLLYSIAGESGIGIAEVLPPLPKLSGSGRR